ncbi:MAG: hypothetical protein RL134_574 [Actinomycetota bacterium]
MPRTPSPHSRQQSRAVLDERTAKLASIAELPEPRTGWTRMVREALAMPAAVLAERLGVADTTVLRLEESERLGTAQINTLRRAADALDCDFVYAFVPRRPLEAQVLEQARARAEAEVGRIAHSMALEDQAVSPRETESLIEARTQEWLDKPGLWDRG